jgi:outer membrane protein assembly factor BamB
MRQRMTDVVIVRRGAAANRERRDPTTRVDSRRRRMLRGLALFAALAVLCAGCDWTQFRYGPAHTGFNPTETKISPANVGTLTPAWTAGTGGGPLFSSPAVVNGVAYVGSDNKFYAFDAAGITNCSGTPNTCAPLWTATLAGAAASSPAVVNGVVYVKSSAFGGIETIYAFDAAGVINCSGAPKICMPLWSTINGVSGSSGASSPTVVNGIVYVGSNDNALYAFDAAGVINCSGAPKTCAPLWSGPLIGTGTASSPAVVNGIVYIGNGDGNLYAFDATGTTNCSGTPKTCAPLWSAPTSSLRFPSIFSSPAVVDGVVYIGSDHGSLYAFDAAGVINCSGSPKTCKPLWTAPTSDDAGDYATESSPAVAHGVVYIGSDGGGLHAFDAAGVINCSGTPKTCKPLWTSPKSVVASSPAVANGVVYVGSFDTNLYAFDAAGTTNCSGTPKTCAPLWSAPTGSFVFSSPAVANGFVYIGSGQGQLYAYNLP